MSVTDKRVQEIIDQTLAKTERDLRIVSKIAIWRDDVATGSLDVEPPVDLGECTWARHMDALRALNGPHDTIKSSPSEKKMEEADMDAAKCYFFSRALVGSGFASASDKTHRIEVDRELMGVLDLKDNPHRHVLSEKAVSSSQAGIKDGTEDRKGLSTHLERISAEVIRKVDGNKKLCEMMGHVPIRNDALEDCRKYYFAWLLLYYYRNDLSYRFSSLYEDVAGAEWYFFGCWAVCSENCPDYQMRAQTTIYSRLKSMLPDKVLRHNRRRHGSPTPSPIMVRKVQQGIDEAEGKRRSLYTLKKQKPPRVAFNRGCMSYNEYTNTLLSR